MVKKEKERFSFSKLNTFLTCRFKYILRYIKHIKGKGNAFSSYGTLLHSIMERYAKGEISLWDLPAIYEWEFEAAIPEEFPPMPRFHKKYGNDMRPLYYDQGLEFLNNFQGYSNLKILEVETAFDYPIGNWIFNGVIDLVIEDENGKLIIIDYKSKSSFKSEAEKAEYARQLYLYSLWVKEKYGRFPDELKFILFRNTEGLDPIPFDEKDLKEAVSWAKGTVAKIRDYPFFCEQLCDNKNLCDGACGCGFLESDDE